MTKMDAAQSPTIAAERIRLLLVDDNPAVLRQVIRVLTAGFEIVGTLENGAGLGAAAEQHRPDIIVLDITLPCVSGIALASQLRDTGCPARVVFLTVHSDPDYARAALAVGAIGYVVKTRLAMDLVPALQAAFRNTRFVSPSPELEGIE